MYNFKFYDYEKVKRKLLIGASTLMFVGAMFVFADSAEANMMSDQALYGNSAGTKFCCGGSGGGCSAAPCQMM